MLCLRLGAGGLPREIPPIALQHADKFCGELDEQLPLFHGRVGDWIGIPFSWRSTKRHDLDEAFVKPCARNHHARGLQPLFPSYEAFGVRVSSRSSEYELTNLGLLLKDVDEHPGSQEPFSKAKCSLEFAQAEASQVSFDSEVPSELIKQPRIGSVFA